MTSTTTTAEQVTQIVAELLDIPVSEIQPHFKLIQHLNFEGMDLLQLRFLIQQRLGVEVLSHDEFERLKTNRPELEAVSVQDVIDRVDWFLNDD